MSEWKPGWVHAYHYRHYVRLEKGQRWVYLRPDLPAGWGNEMLLTVISTSVTGETFLRPDDRRKAEELFPLKTITFKGKDSVGRESPFMWVGLSTGILEPGDLAVHEAWDVWANMWPYVDPESF